MSCRRRAARAAGAEGMPLVSSQKFAKVMSEDAAVVKMQARTRRPLRVEVGRR